MTEPAGPPRWELLPHDPAGFFGLDADFDRTALKRAYNRNLQQFKPEKFPEEFQRIRAAYEALDQELRYGAREMRRPTYRPEPWKPPAEPPPPPPRSEKSRPTTEPDISRPAPRPAPRPTPPPPLHARLEHETPQKIYYDLKRKQSKSPYDYFCLALIADSLPEPDDLPLLKWLLAALQEHPRDPASFQLLFTYLRTGLQPDEAGKALLAISQVVRGDRFYFLTEPVWDLLLTSDPFPSFRETLKACEARQPVHEVVGRNTFYVHLLRKALWRADADWLKQGFALLDDVAGELPHTLDLDLHLLTVLRSYRELRDQFLDGSSLRDAIDRVLRIYCEEDDVAVERAFLTLQLRAAADADEVLKAFPFVDEADPACEVVRQAWSLIDADLIGRIALTGSDNERPSTRQQSMLRWIEAMEVRAGSSPRGQLWDVASFLVDISHSVITATVILLLCSQCIPIAITLMRNHQSETLIILGGLVAAVLAAFAVALWSERLIVDRLVTPWWKSYCRRTGRNLYVNIWRREFANYLQQTRLRFGDAQDLMADQYDDRLQLCAWLLRYSQNDFGLAFYATALQYAA